MKRALVTGATGFVGANLARRLVHDGHDVHLLVRSNHTTWRLEGLREHAHIHVADLNDRRDLTRLLSTLKPEWIFHLAVYGAYPAQADWRTMIDVNVLGTMNLVTAATSVGFEAFVNTGSSSEYGVKDHAPSETEWLDPNSYYAVSKASATLFCRHTAHVLSMVIPTLRLYSAYGPYEEPTRLLPRLLVNAHDGALPPLVDPDVARDFTYVTDVCDAYILAATRPIADPGAVFNVGSGRQTTLRELVNLVRRKHGIAEEPRWGSMPKRSWDTVTWVADNQRARRELGWAPTTDLEAGIHLMSEWLRADRALLDRYRRSASG